MFGIDRLIFYFIFSNCKALGATFGLGALEGFILYSGAIVACISTVLGKKEKK